jgi:hypothetical protein
LVLSRSNPPISTSLDAWLEGENNDKRMIKIKDIYLSILRDIKRGLWPLIQI